MVGIHTRRRLLILAVTVSSVMVILAVKRLYIKDNYETLPQNRPDLPMNYVYKAKGKTTPKFRPGLEVNLAPAVLLKSYMSPEDVENNFFNYIETKSVICDDNRRLGNQHEGGWNVCLSPPFNLSRQQPCLVYSYGIGEDWRFEDDMYDLFNCKVKAFDPSILLKEHNRTDGIWFRPLGLGDKNFVTDKGWKLKTFRQFLVDEGDVGKPVDYLKFDVEYMEWAILPSLVQDDSLYNVKQLAFEIHLKHPTESPTRDLFVSKAQFLEKYQILSALEKLNFKLFDYRMNPFCSYSSNVTTRARSRCYELHYLNMNFVSPKHLKHPRQAVLPLLA